MLQLMGKKIFIKFNAKKICEDGCHAGHLGYGNRTI